MLRKVALHEALAVLVLAAAVGNAETPEPGDKTAPVSTGAVASTVAATGNLDAPRTVGVTFNGNPGLVTKLGVRVGDEVEAGQELAEVDKRPATRQLQLSRAALVTARGQLAVAKETLHGDGAAVAAAVRSFRNAVGAVRDAKVQLHVDRDAHDHLIDAQEENLEANLRDRTTLHNATASRTAAHNHARTTNSVAANPNFPAVVTTDTRARAAQRQRTNSVTASTTRSQVAQAGVGLVTAQADRATTIVQDQHNLLNAIREAKLARAQVAVAAAADGVVHPGGMVPGLIQQAKGAVADAKAQVGQAQDALDDTVLKAPFKGTILDIAGDVGETPVAAARGNSSPPASPNGPGAVEDRRQATQSGFVTLADLSRRVVTAQIAEKDIRKIQTGQSAQVTFPSTGAVLTGTVNAIEPQETVVDHVVQYNVKVDLDNRAANQMLGQSASVVITTASRTNVLKVPSSAVRSGGPGQGVLTVKRGNDFVKLPVTVGLSGDGETEVASPLLKSGDLVLVPGRRPDGGA